MTDLDVREAIDHALSGALAGADEMVTKWVACIETVDTDGQRSIWLMSPEGAKPWDNLGMLQFAAMQEQAQVMRYDVEGDDGDE